MKKLFFALLMSITSFGFAESQDSTHRGFEFGPTLVTYYGFPILFSRLKDPEGSHLASIKLFNGVQLNCNFRNFSLRSQYSYVNENSPESWRSDRTFTSTKQLKLGGQYYFKKKARGWYAFGDFTGTIENQQLKTSDYRVGHYSYESKMKGYGWDIGLGYKVRVYRNLFVSTEISSNTIRGRIKGEYIYYDKPERSRTFDGRYGDNRLVARVILTMKIK